MKVVINNCYGGFGLSHEGMMRYGEIKGTALYPEHDSQFPSLKLVTYWTVPQDKRPKLLTDEEFYAAPMEERKASNEAYGKLTMSCREISRDDPVLVQLVEEMGKDADGKCARLKVIEIPDGVNWELDEYDGLESVHEVHRSWS